LSPEYSKVFHRRRAKTSMVMHLNRVRPIIWSLFLLFFISTTFAQGNSVNAPGRLFGMGQPHSINDLPPGQLKSTLEGLSPKARGKALDWLQGFSFPAEDVAYLRVDSQGSVYYVEAGAPTPDDINVTESTITSSMAEAAWLKRHQAVLRLIRKRFSSCTAGPERIT